MFVIMSFAVLGAYKDGVYYVAADKPTFGWKPFTQVTVKDGKISDIIFDRLNKKGELASKNSGYNKGMKKSVGTNPSEYSVNMPKNFFETNQNFDKMDGFAGATDSLREFKIMTKFLLEKAEKGETGKFEIGKDKLK